MKKNSGKNFQILQVDPISGNYYITIPEWIANDLSWYEDTNLNLEVECGERIITEDDEND
jgi:hypothetical protein